MFFYSRSENINTDNESYLLRNETENTILIDFGSGNSLKNERHLSCKY
jgi:hypothetical protein